MPICDTCKEESNDVSRVVIDNDYDKTLAKPLYNCHPCFLEKDFHRDYKTIETLYEDYLKSKESTPPIKSAQILIKIKEKIPRLKYISSHITECKQKLLTEENVQSLLEKINRFILRC